MNAKDQIVTASCIKKLGSRTHESELARFWWGKKLSAPEVCNRVSCVITDWHANGNAVQTADHEVLDIHRVEFRGEAFVYCQEGELIVQRTDKVWRKGESGERIVYLDSLETAFGEDPGRSITRMFEKLNNPAGRAVDWRSLSMLFWMDVASQIETRQIAA